MTTRVADDLQTLSPSAGPGVTGIADDVLLKKLVAGDASAAHALVGRYHGPLMRYLRRLSGQDALAEELHQQTWLSVLEHASRFDAKISGGFKAWLFRIATNKANDLWRKRRREMTGGDYFATLAASERPDRMEANEQASRVAEAIAKLPDAQRQVLLLRYYSGLKFSEIAESLGCPLNTALGRMHKAIIRLRTLLVEANGGEDV